MPDELGIGFGHGRVEDALMVGGPDRIAEQAQQLLDAGLDGLIFNMPHMEDPEAIELAGKTLAGLRHQAVAR